MERMLFRTGKGIIRYGQDVSVPVVVDVDESVVLIDQSVPVFRVRLYFLC